MSYPESHEIIKIIETANKIVVIQADNPDGDSLGSALALEEILGELGKEVALYCGVDIPDYLKHLKGWDRATKDIPSQFDASIIVDTSAIILLDKLEHSDYRNWIAAKPVIVLDHHSDVACDIPYAKIVINDNDAVATGEVIYKLAKEAAWDLNLQAKTHVASSILSDSLGLSSEGTTANTYRIMADLISGGVDRPALEEARRAFMKMSQDIFRYKGELIGRTELLADGELAMVTIPYEEIKEYSHQYNPAPLIQNDMLQIEGVKVAIVLKQYNDGHVTGSIRCNYGIGIAAELAKGFGGGGHAYASGFNTKGTKTYEAVQSECIEKTTALLATLKQESSRETA